MALSQIIFNQRRLALFRVVKRQGLWVRRDVAAKNRPQNGASGGEELAVA